MWNIGQVEKATQMGTRYAVVTDMVPSGLFNYSFAISGGIPQGTVVQETHFRRITCSSTADGTVTCQCPAGDPCAFGTTVKPGAFPNIVNRMKIFYGGIGPENIVITYTNSGLGFAGDPNGSDVDPIVTITVQDLAFRPISLGTLANLGLPGTSHSLTMEDGEGDRGY